MVDPHQTMHLHESPLETSDNAESYVSASIVTFLHRSNTAHGAYISLPFASILSNCLLMTTSDEYFEEGHGLSLVVFVCSSTCFVLSLTDYELDMVQDPICGQLSLIKTIHNSLGLSDKHLKLANQTFQAKGSSNSSKS